MIVTVAIFSIVLTGLSLFFVRLWNSQGFILETGIASLIATRGVDNAVGRIREAVESDAGSFPIVRATNTEFEFYVDYDDDDDVDKLRYFVDSANDKFRVGIVEPSATIPVQYVGTNCSSGEVCEDVSDYLVNDVLDPVFEYYDEYNVLIPPDGGTGLVPPGQIRLVKVLLYVNPDPDQAPDNVKVQSFVHIRNLSNFGKAPT